MFIFFGPLAGVMFFVMLFGAYAEEQGMQVTENGVKTLVYGAIGGFVLMLLIMGGILISDANGGEGNVLEANRIARETATKVEMQSSVEKFRNTMVKTLATKTGDGKESLDLSGFSLFSDSFCKERYRKDILANEVNPNLDKYVLFTIVISVEYDKIIDVKFMQYEQCFGSLGVAQEKIVLALDGESLKDKAKEVSECEKQNKECERQNKFETDAHGWLVNG